MAFIAKSAAPVASARRRGTGPSTGPRSGAHLLRRPARVPDERGRVRGPPAAGAAGDLGPARPRGPRPRHVPASLVAAVQRHHPGFGGDPRRVRTARFELAATLAEAAPAPASLVVEHAHHLGGTARPCCSACCSPRCWTRTGPASSPATPLPAGALPGRGATVTADDLRLGPGAAGLLGREAPRLPAAAARRAATLCRGAAADLVAVCRATATLGPGRVEQALDQASEIEELLAQLASGWLEEAGADAHRALALALEIGYSHPALSAVLGAAAGTPAGPWFQPLADGWSTVRTGWHDPLRAAWPRPRPWAPRPSTGPPTTCSTGTPPNAPPRCTWSWRTRCAAGAAAAPAVTLAPPLAHVHPAGEPDGHLLTVHLLGQLKVRLDDVAVDDWPSGRGRSLLKYLVTHRDPWPRRSC